MIYLTWEDETNSVIKGFNPDGCSSGENQIDYVDANLDMGTILLGETGTTRVMYLSIYKFASTPLRAITGVKFFLAPYYDGSVVTTIPASYAEDWTFCEGATTSTSEGYTSNGGTRDPATDLTELTQAWPEYSGGIQICVDKCTWITFTSTVGKQGEEGTYIDLDYRAGGSTVNNRIDPGNRAEIRLRSIGPTYIAEDGDTTIEGVRLALLGTEYAMSE